jgi:hypothetical protein
LLHQTTIGGDPMIHQDSLLVMLVKLQEHQF